TTQYRTIWRSYIIQTRQIFIKEAQIHIRILCTSKKTPTVGNTLVKITNPASAVATALHVCTRTNTAARARQSVVAVCSAYNVPTIVGHAGIQIECGIDLTTITIATGRPQDVVAFDIIVAA
ncbi:hypothetical protein LNV47_25035, partial [Paucibacter sp. DJ4R-1]|nr:hypothetical protein [Paucibacter sp. DJ4R-1]